MAVVKQIKECATCMSLEVCKYYENRGVLLDHLNECISDFEGNTFEITLSCNKHNNNLRERGI